MQAIGVSPAANAADTLRLTVASVSPNSVRRSEWPMITNSAPASLIIGALTSPVNAPSRSQYKSCAAIATLLLRAASAAACSAGNGGATTISTSVMSLTRMRNSLTYFTASATVLYIFQFPAMKGVLISSLRQRRDPRQRLPSEELERGAAAGRNVRDAIGHASLRDRGDGIAAADDGGPVDVGDRECDRDRPLC